MATTWGIGYNGRLYKATNRQPWDGNATPPPAPAPAASFTATNTNLTVSVNSSSTVGAITSYAWNWDDGTPDTSGASPSHTYAAAGIYLIRLTVADDQGRTSTTTRSLIVNTVANAHTYSSGVPRHIFSPDSFWYKQLPANTPLDPESSNKVNFLIQTALTPWGNADLGYPSWTLNNHTNTPSIIVIHQVKQPCH